MEEGIYSILNINSWKIPYSAMAKAVSWSDWALLITKSPILRSQRQK